MNRDPRNHVGKHILDECKANNVTYQYACRNKIRHPLLTFTSVVQNQSSFLNSLGTAGASLLL